MSYITLKEAEAALDKTHTLPDAIDKLVQRKLRALNAQSGEIELAVWDVTNAPTNSDEDVIDLGDKDYRYSVWVNGKEIADFFRLSALTD